MYVGNQLIRPRWMKVSKTPWTSLKAAERYGAGLQPAISDEMPPHYAHRRGRRPRRPRADQAGASKPVKGKHVQDACSDDAPVFPPDAPATEMAT